MCSQREKVFVFVLVFVHRGVSGVSDGVETSDPSLQGGSRLGFFPNYLTLKICIGGEFVLILTEVFYQTDLSYEFYKL